MEVKISNGNIKMGNIPSVSLPAWTTCRSDCECRIKCYGKKIERLRPNVRRAYQHNYDLLRTDPDTYWRDIEAVIMMSKYFRFHVSGDIPNDEYLYKMIEIAQRNQHCQILCFTKKYEIVNRIILNNTPQFIPSNLHIIFSAWRGLDMNNPNRFPEAHVRYKDGTTTANNNAKKCGGNCTKCAQTSGGCWTLGTGEQVIFDEH